MKIHFRSYINIILQTCSIIQTNHMLQCMQTFSLSCSCWLRKNLYFVSSVPFLHEHDSHDSLPLIQLQLYSYNVCLLRWKVKSIFLILEHVLLLQDKFPRQTNNLQTANGDNTVNGLCIFTTFMSMILSQTQNAMNTPVICQKEQGSPHFQIHRCKKVNNYETFTKAIHSMDTATDLTWGTWRWSRSSSCPVETSPSLQTSDWVSSCENKVKT